MRRLVPTLLLLYPLLNACGEVEEPAREDEDRDGYTVAEGDCNDGDPNIYPGALDRPAANNEEIGLGNGIDEDCDDIEAVLCYRDADNDGHGGESGHTVTDPAGNCETSPYFSLEDDDCADNDPAVHPGAEEVCDGRDNDCDGIVDPPLDDLDAWSVGYIDEDQDGDGAAGSAPITRCSNDPELAPTDGDCDDNDPDVRGADQPDEICDGKDNNCDTLYLQGEEPGNRNDWDGDGYFTCSCPDCDCNLNNPSTWDPLHCGDCNDNDPTMNPDGYEICGDGYNSDCDAETDETEDMDEDGFSTCGEPGYEDCNDGDPLIFPGADEDPGSCIDRNCDGQVPGGNNVDQCGDGIDNDCDGIVDEDGADIMIVSTDPAMRSEISTLLAQSEPGPAFCSGYVDGRSFRDNDENGDLSLESFRLVIFTPDMANAAGEPGSQPLPQGLLQVIEHSYLNRSDNSNQYSVPSLLGMGYAGKALYGALFSYQDYDLQGDDNVDLLGQEIEMATMAIQCGMTPYDTCDPSQTPLGVALPNLCSPLDQFHDPGTGGNAYLFFTNPNYVDFTFGAPVAVFASAIDTNSPNSQPGLAYPLWSGNPGSTAASPSVQFIAEPGCTSNDGDCWSNCGVERGLVARQEINFSEWGADLPGQPTISDQPMLYHWGWDAAPSSWTVQGKRLFKNVACWAAGGSSGNPGCSATATPG